MQKLRDNIWLTLIMVVVACVASFYAGQVTRVFFVHASAQEITVEEALKVIDAGRASHQYFIDTPGSTNLWTGDVAQNKRWVDNYDALENIIIRQQNRILDLENENSNDSLHD